MDYHIRVNPKDGDLIFSPEGFLHMGPANGLLVGLFEGQYHYIEFTKAVKRLDPSLPLKTTIKGARTPWGE